MSTLGFRASQRGFKAWALQYLLPRKPTALLLSDPVSVSARQAAAWGHLLLHTVRLSKHLCPGKYGSQGQTSSLLGPLRQR